MAAKKLSDEQKRFIVQSLARFESPSELVQLLKQDYDVEVTPQALQGYDPTKTNGQNLSKQYKELFEETRQQYLSDVNSIGIAQRAFRLNKLHDMAMAALSRKNYAQAAQFMEQAAKEVGGAFTNKREIGGPNGGPIEHEHHHLTDEQRMERIAAIAERARQKRA